MGMYANGKKVSGTVSNATAINCLDKDGNKSTVQKEIDKLNVNSIFTYNPEDDYVYLLGSKWKYAGLKSQPLIPKLTDFTGTNGSVVYTSKYATAANYAWKAFDGDDTTAGCGATGAVAEGHLGYTFNQKVLMNRVKLIYSNPHSAVKTISSKIQYYNGSTWIDIPNTTFEKTMEYLVPLELVYDFGVIESYGVRVVTSCADKSQLYIYCLQAYGTIPE